MSRYLLQIGLGPVQSFIAASRKTRDLAAGSELLVKVGNAAVDSLRPKGDLIFPGELVGEISAGPKEPPAANVILIWLNEGVVPESAAADAKRAALSKLQGEFDNAFSDYAGANLSSDNIARLERGRAQLVSMFEWFAAWAIYDGTDYQGARHRLGAAFAARKSLRDFEEPQCEGYDSREDTGWKSALDPSLVGILPQSGSKVEPAIRMRYHLKPHEHLDAAGVIKRFSGRRTFDSTADIAAAAHIAWLRGRDFGGGSSSERARLALRSFERVQVKDSDTDETLTTAEKIFAPNLPSELAKFKKSLLESLQESGLGPLKKSYAILHADGDSMGEALNAIRDPGGHRAFSAELAKFAAGVPKIVGDREGQCVYAGGDDILALAPLPTALQCAKLLREAFDEANLGEMTLTVGLAIVPLGMNLQEAVRYSASLEKAGKALRPGHIGSEESVALQGWKGKDALCVGVQSSGGQELRVAMPWKTKPVDMINDLVTIFTNEPVTRGFPYEVRSLADELSRLPSTWLQADLSILLRAEYARIRDRKKKMPEGSLSLPDWVASARDLRVWANLLLMAHFLTREGES